MKQPEKMTPANIVDELNLWVNCHKDAYNYDSRLLKSAAKTIKNLLFLLANEGVMYKLINDEVVWQKYEDGDDLIGKPLELDGQRLAPTTLLRLKKMG